MKMSENQWKSFGRVAFLQLTAALLLQAPLLLSQLLPQVVVAEHRGRESIFRLATLALKLQKHLAQRSLSFFIISSFFDAGYVSTTKGEK